MRFSPFAAAVGVCLLAAPAAQAFEPTDDYSAYSFHGFTVLLAPGLAKNRRDADAVRRQVDIELERLAAVVPDKALRVLRRTRVWVEWDAPADRSPIARFFPGAGAVRAYGLNPEKADGVEVLNARRFLAAYGAGAQWVLMHELAHAYHHLALDKHDGAVRAAHKQAVERRLYENVEHFNGARARGYAVTNHYEYYATLSESYFGKSFNFPYDRAGLLRFDTVGYWLMHDTWGKPK